MFVLKLVFPSTFNINKNSTLDWIYKNDTSDMTWEALVVKLGEFTKMKKGKFYVSWHDGNEYCTISTTESLREAVKIMRKSDTYEVPILYVFPVVSCDKSKVSAYFGGGLAENLPKDFRERMREMADNSDYVDDAGASERTLLAECAVCHVKDWPDDKYTCLVCPRLVFCPRCYQNVGHQDHPTLITRGGATYPGAVLTAVRAVTKNINEPDSSEDSDVEEVEVRPDCGPSLTPPPRSTTRRPISVVKPKEADVVTDPEADAVIATLRQMGFDQDYQQLSSIVKAENYDVTAIVEKLTSA